MAVEKFASNSKTYEKITDEPLLVSMDPKFIFLNEKLGFVISKSNLAKSNDYNGIKVTQDGGKKFIESKINYDNKNIEILTVEGVSYIDNGLLKLPCSIYQISEDKTSYEDVRIFFISTDNGLNWYLESN